MLSKFLSFRFRLSATIFAVAVVSTLIGLFYSYRIAESYIRQQMLNRFQDFGRLSASHFSEDELTYLAEIDKTINPRVKNGTTVVEEKLSATVLTEEEKYSFLRDPTFQKIAQKLQSIRLTSLHDLQPNRIISKTVLGSEQKPTIERIWIAGVEMHAFMPSRLRVLSSYQFASAGKPIAVVAEIKKSVFELGDIIDARNITSVSRALDGRFAVSDGYQTEGADVFISTSTPLRNAEGKIVALLMVDFSAATEIDALFQLKTTGYYVLIAVFLLSSMAAAAISRVLLKPIEAMRRATLRIGQRDFAARIETTNHDELADLAGAMNTLAEELGEYSSQMEARITERTHEIGGILEALEQGVFTIDKNGIIQPEYSKASLTIFALKDIANRRFSDLFREEKLRNTIEKYIDILFGQQEISKLMLEKANPVSQIQYVNLAGETRHLRFSFRPLWRIDTAASKRILVTIIDDTYGVNLEKKLSDAEVQNRNEYDALIRLMRIPMSILNAFHDQQVAFLQDAKQLIAHFDDLENDKGRFLGKTHALKGNALQLGFQQLAEYLHDAEEILHRIENADADEKRVLRRNFSIVVKCCEDAITARGKLTERIRELIHPTPGEGGQETVDKLTEFWKNQIQEKAQKYHIEATAHIALNKESIDALYRVHNILVQLLRNTFAHGRETAVERTRKGKREEMQVGLSTRFFKDATEIIYTEDGRGFKEIGAGETLTLDVLLQKRLTRPAKTITLEAGRGLGLGFIAENLHSLNAQMEISSTGKVLQFLIRLPHR